MIMAAENATSSSSNFVSAGEGITGGYEGDSLPLKIIIAFFLGLAMYNVVELLIIIFGTFVRYKGLYFWALVCSALGIIPYAMGFLFKYFEILKGNGRWFSVFLLSIGWYPMVTGQALVLWSRLHLVLHGERGARILRRTKWMIIINAICLHIPTSTLTIGSNAGLHRFVVGYNIMEKIQMCGFFLQEVILSSIYILETLKILKTSIQENTRRLMYQLMAINILIIVMDLGLLGLECASLYILETIFKGFLYSVKLKLEFAILSRLVQFVGGGKSLLREDNPQRRRSTSFAFVPSEKSRGGSETSYDPYDVTDCVDITKTNNHGTFVVAGEVRRGSNLRPRPGVTELDLDMARLEHNMSETSKPNGDIESQG